MLLSLLLAAAYPTGIVADPCAEAVVQPAKDIDIKLRDFGQLCKYRAESAAQTASGKPVRIVLFGDSITEGWLQGDPSLFRDGIVDRGISGQTSAQMLVRFRQDVVALHPRAVHIMAGINDIAGNSGPTTIATIVDNQRSMAEIARAHGIRVVIASVLPAAAFPWALDKRPAPLVVELNRQLRAMAAERGDTFVDYYPAMANRAGGLDPALAGDGVHPSPMGYARLRPILDKVIATIR